MPGDIWENDTVTAATIGRVMAACASLGDIPVLIAPGNKDFYCPYSPYNAEALKVRGLPAWPANVFAFSGDSFMTIRHPRRADVTFTGRAFTSSDVVQQRLLSGELPKDPSAINFLVFHGALEGYAGSDLSWPGKQTAPFSAAELAGQKFTYAALGHYHEFCEVRLESGLLLGAYAGCLGGRSFEEPGAHCALLGTVSKAADDSWSTDIELVELDSRRMISVGADVTGLSGDDMMDEITLAIEDQAARPDRDMILVHLDGRCNLSNEPDQLLEQLRARYPQLIVVDKSRPDYLSEKYDQRTTEAKYIDALLSLKRDLERARGTAGDTTTEELSGSIVEDALYYGLDALRRKRITIRDVD
jgi:DNA repair exonuclease SbcCD nuclease subunit